MIESHKRTILRMITYRITAWLFTILWTYLFLGNIGEATGFATILHVLLSVDYYIHERVWLRIRWGMVSDQQRQDQGNYPSHSVHMTGQGSNSDVGH